MQAGPPKWVAFECSLGGRDDGIVIMPSKFLATPAVLAALSLTAAPAAAAELPMARAAPVQSSVRATGHYGPHVSIGGGWGWGRGDRHYRRHRGGTAGDILTGVVILGAIAAVANAARRGNERRSYPDRYPYPDRRTDYRPDVPPNGPQGLEGAADLCLRAVERNARAREVTRVERTASGWLVTGSMADGAAFNCSIGADGRIEGLDVGGRAQDLSAEDRQPDDDRYRSARAEVEGTGDSGAEAGPQPDYPGGPLPGEEAEAEPTPES